VRISRRHVIYVQGYDPRGLAQYYRMFRTELRKFAALYQLKTEVTRPEQSDDHARARWQITTKADDWSVETTYDFLRWEDVIAKDFSRSTLSVIGTCFWVLVWMVSTRALFRFFYASWRFALFILYPYVAFVLQAAAAALAGWSMAKLAEWAAAPPWLGAGLGILVGIGALAAMIKWFERRTYMLYLMNDIISTYQFAHGQRPDWTDRMALFARHLVEVIGASDADEILVVGHSSGTFLAVDVLAQALARDPDLGRRGPALRLLTLGGNLPIVGFVPAAQWFRDQLRRLATDRSIDWIDYQARKDVMNFFNFDPIKGHRIDLGNTERNLVSPQMNLRSLIDPSQYSHFRWRFFRVHFQFIMANDRPAAYDFFMILCGPLDLLTRVFRPGLALRAASRDRGERRAAFDKLDLANPPSPPIAPAE